MKSLIILVIIVNLWLSANCVTFNCKFKMEDWLVVGNVYACDSATVLLSSGTELQQVTGKHESGKSDANVEALDVEDTNCPFIPTKIETFFPNLLAIQFGSTNLKVLTSTDLRPFPMLKVFVSYNNLIESLDGDVFDNNIQLEWVTFYSNQLVNIGHNLLDLLTKLQHVNFNINPCIDFRATTPAEIAQLKQKLIDQCPSTTCGLVKEFSLCGAKFSNFIESQIVVSQTQKQVTKMEQQFTEIKQQTENANMKQALEIVKLQDENEALKTHVKKLENQIESIQRLIDNLNMRFQE